MKKILCIIMSLFIMAGGCPVVFGARIMHDGNCGRYVVWNITEDGVLNIIGDGSMQYEFSTDGRVDATPPWEQYKTDIVKIYVSDNITDIGNGAFYGCKNADEIRLPKSLSHIYRNAFAGCRSLKNIELSDNIHYIGENAFENCTSLDEIKIPDNVTEISPSAFRGCKSLKKVIFNDKLESIGYAAFHGCENLDGVAFPHSLKSIGESAFGACADIEEIDVPQSVTELGEGAFADCVTLKKVVISAYTERLNRYIFSGCSNLTEVHIPHKVNYISDSTFSSCSNLKDIYYDGTVEEWNYAERRAHIHMEAPDCIIHCLREPPQENSDNTEVEAENKNDTEVKEENTENTLPEIDEENNEPEFKEDNSNEDKEELPSDIKNQPETEDVDLPENNKTDDENGKNITSGKHGSNISWNYNSGVLTLNGNGEMDEEISRSRMGWDDYRESIKEIIISDGITSISDYAFWKCKKVEKIVIPDSVTKIGRSSFSRCESLKTAVIPQSVKTIDKSAFRDCDSLTILCEKNSDAHIYAKERKVNYELTGGVKTDFKTSDWANDEIVRAYENDLIPESMLEMDLTKFVTREEFVAIAVKLYEVLNDTKVNFSKNPFSDVNKSIYLNEILAGYYLGITSGTTPTTFEPYNKITREQLATMLCRVAKMRLFKGWKPADDHKYKLDITGVQKFEDDADISEYAKDSVYFMYKNGIIKGISNSKFAPKNMNKSQEESGYAYATAEQALIMALRTYEVYKNF